MITETSRWKLIGRLEFLGFRIDEGKKIIFTKYDTEFNKEQKGIVDELLKDNFSVQFELC